MNYEVLDELWYIYIYSIYFFFFFTNFLLKSNEKFYRSNYRKERFALKQSMVLEEIFLFYLLIILINFSILKTVRSVHGVETSIICYWYKISRHIKIVKKSELSDLTHGLMVKVAGLKGSRNAALSDLFFSVYWTNPFSSIKSCIFLHLTILRE